MYYIKTSTNTNTILNFEMSVWFIYFLKILYYFHIWLGILLNNIFKNTCIDVGLYSWLETSILINWFVDSNNRFNIYLKTKYPRLVWVINLRIYFRSTTYKRQSNTNISFQMSLNRHHTVWNVFPELGVKISSKYGALNIHRNLRITKIVKDLW